MENNGVSGGPDDGVKEGRNSFFVIVWLVIPLAMLAYGIHVQRTNDSLIFNSSMTTGELIAPPVQHRLITHTQISDSLRFEYGVDYRIIVDGHTYTGHESITRRHDFKVITVYYEVGNPANNRANMPNIYAGWIWIWLALLLGLAIMSRKLWWASFFGDPRMVQPKSGSTQS